MKRTTRLLLSVAGSIVVLVVVLLTGHTAMAGGFAGGSGTEEDPWEIETPEQLASVADAVYLESHFELISNIDLTDYLSEGGEGWNEGAGWEPIGTPTTPFTGSLNGNGHSVIGLYINRPTENLVGLFGEIGSTSLIHDVNLVSANITGRSAVGVLAGRNYGSIDGSSASGEVEATVNLAGGLTGINEGEITDCHVTDEVVGPNGIGALVGINHGTVAGSSATGTVTGEQFIGGLCGRSGITEESMITNCYAAVTVTADGAESEYIGGLVGRNEINGTIEKSYATGTVIEDEDGSQFVGGLVGENKGGVTTCYATGAVTGASDVGGLVGSNSGTVAASYYDRETSGQSDAGKGIPTTTVLMHTPVTFSGWDFLSTWGINPDDNGGYPFLRWQTECFDARFAGGTGDVGNPYKVATAWQLNNVRMYLDKHYVQVADIDLSGYGAGWNGGAGWMPIGRYVYSDPSTTFTGSFDGGGFEITGLYIHRPSEFGGVGLFGHIDGESNGTAGALKNVKLLNVSVHGPSNIGGLAGSRRACTIANCHVTGSVSGETNVGGLVGGVNYREGQAQNTGEIIGSSADCSVTGLSSVGGLAGLNVSGTITRSYAAGDVKAISKFPISHKYCGGLVGENHFATIIECYATAHVDSTLESDQIQGTGGLVGFSYFGQIERSYAVGDVTGGVGAGGLVGDNWSGWIVDCYAAGDVTGTEKVGDLVGDQDGQVLTSKHVTTVQMQTPVTFAGWDFAGVWAINPAQNDGYPFLRWQTEFQDGQFAGGTGDVGSPYKIATAWQLRNIGIYLDKHFVLVNDIDMYVAPYNEGQGWEPIGTWVNFFDPGNAPFTGSLDGGDRHVIENLFINRPGVDSVGLFSGIEDAIITNVRLENVHVTGNDFVGGLVGHNLGLITRSYVTGEVLGANNVGGMVGQNFYTGTVEGSFSVATVSGTDRVGCLLGANYSGEVTESYATGGVSGNRTVGGLAGFNDGHINGCYAAGAVFATDASSAGGLVGYMPGGTVTASYYDSETSGNRTTRVRVIPKPL